MILYDLAIIFVRCHHVHLKAIGCCAGGQGSNDVIGFVAIQLKNGDVETAYDLFHNRQAVPNVFGCFLACSLVLFVQFIAKRRRGCIEGHPNVRWLLFGEHLHQRIGKPKRNRCISAFGINARVFGKRKMGPVNQRVGIEQEEFFFGWHVNHQR